MIAFAVLLFYPNYQYRQEWQLRHQKILDFQSAIQPLLQSNPKFEFVSVGVNTGGRSGSLAGLVDSTNDLEKLRTIYSTTLSNHPARVNFHVKIDEHLFN